MPVGLIVAALLGLGIVVAAVVATIRAPRLQAPARVMSLIMLVPFALIALYGLIASREPGVSLTWSVLYVTVLVACLAAAGRIALARRALP